MERYRVTIFIIIVVLTWIIYYLFFLPKISKQYQTQSQSTQNQSSNTQQKKEEQTVKIVEEIFSKNMNIDYNHLNLTLATSDTSIKFEAILPEYYQSDKNLYKLVHEGIMKLIVDEQPLKIQLINFKDNNILIKFSEVNKISSLLSCNSSNEYLIDCNILFENEQNNLIEIHPSLYLSASMFAESNSTTDIELVHGYFFNENFKYKSISATKEYLFEKDAKKKSKWIGMVNKYFAFSIIWESEDTISKHSYTILRSTDKNVNGIFSNNFTKISIYPKSSTSISFKMYMGPKKKELLNKYKDLKLDVLYKFGLFDSISKFLFLILTFLYDIFKNYGIAIIFLTLIVRLCLFPVSVLHQRSLFKLQIIQPLIEKIKEKYKDDKEKMKKEFKKIYEKYRINPLMGCLPLFIQIPILFALFHLFDKAIELRGAHFLWWINDLSQPDRAINLKKTIFGDNFLHILPILNIIASIIQIIMSKGTMGASSTPTEQEKSMKLFMYLMPIIFGFALYSAPSGLNLYWLFTTSSSILETYLIKKMVKKEDFAIKE